jgi:8-amino-3,8-dideoxy-alpha-D-manno-octulosonate transaminase
MDLGVAEVGGTVYTGAHTMAQERTPETTRHTDELGSEPEAPVRAAPLPLEFPGVHFFDEEEVEAVTRVLRARSPFRFYGLDLQGEAESFEREFAAFLGVRHAVAVGSGTGALSVALAALGVGPGQEVIIPAYLWVSIAAAVVQQGAIPVLADIDETFGLNPASVEERVTGHTTGIILAHMSGAPADVEAIAALARRRGLWLLEDCAQCAGGSIHGRKVGTFGDMGVFSFQMNKNMTAGEGGCVVTNDDRLARRAEACHDLGYARDARGRLIFDQPELRLWGKGTRLDELRAAVLRVQLRKLPAIVAAMRRSKYRVRQALEQFPAVRLRRILDPEGDTGCFLITTYESPEVARRVNAGLRAQGIGTYPQGISNIVMTEWGLHLYYNIPSLVHRTSVEPSGFPWNLAENRGLGGDYRKGACPVADSLFERSILLPIPSCLSTKDEDDIIRAFEKVLRAESKG